MIEHFFSPLRHSDKSPEALEAAQVEEFWASFTPLLPDGNHPMVTPEDRRLDLHSLTMNERQALAARWMNTSNRQLLDAYQEAKDDFLHLHSQV